MLKQSEHGGLRRNFSKDTAIVKWYDEACDSGVINKDVHLWDVFVNLVKQAAKTD